MHTSLLTASEQNRPMHGASFTEPANGHLLQVQQSVQINIQSIDDKTTTTMTLSESSKQPSVATMEELLVAAGNGAVAGGGHVVVHGDGGGRGTALESDTRDLIRTFLMDFAGVSSSSSSSSPSSRRRQSDAHATMKRVVEKAVEKHRYLFNGMIRKLKLDDGRGDDTMGGVGAVAAETFSDGTTNWGRVASLVAFGAVVCQQLKEEEEDRERRVGLVAQEISTYLLTHQREWLVKNNSWDGFVEFFRVSDPESTVRSTLLMAVAGVAGVGLVLALFR